MKLGELIKHLTALHTALGEANVLVQERDQPNAESMRQKPIGIVHRLMLPPDPPTMIYRLGPNDVLVPPTSEQQVVIVFDGNGR